MCYTNFEIYREEKCSNYILSETYRLLFGASKWFSKDRVKEFIMLKHRINAVYFDLSVHQWNVKKVQPKGFHKNIKQHNCFIVDKKCYSSSILE